MTDTMTAQVRVPSAGVWTIDPAHNNVGFVARHMMVAKVRGRFTDVDGEVRLGETPETSSVEVRIRAGRIDTGHPDRDAHLRSPDFLDVEESPYLTFKSTRVEAIGDTSLKLHGDLTIRGVTRPVVLDVEYEGLTSDPRMGTRAGFSATTEIDREQWGLTWNMALETGGWLVSKNVRIEIDVELVQQQSDQEAAQS
jgi:polyisoprenoid-binding protein YceI